MIRGLFPIGLIVILTTACHQPGSHAQRLPTSVSAVDEASFQALWKSCKEVLRRHHFTIDRADLRAGMMTTFPQSSQHFFEFWRHDVDTPYDWAESTLHTMRRWVEINISRHDNSEYQIQITVNKQRYRTVERQINNAAAALQVFSTDAPTTSGGRFDRQKYSSWTSQGRDGAMEKHLLQEILNRYHTGNAKTQDSPPNEPQPQNT